MDNYERKSVSNSVIKNSSLKNAGYLIKIYFFFNFKIVLDELKILEMKEIQEEENYIYHIKKQREKVYN